MKHLKYIDLSKWEYEGYVAVHAEQMAKVNILCTRKYGSPSAIATWHENSDLPILIAGGLYLDAQANLAAVTNFVAFVEQQTAPLWENLELPEPFTIVLRGEEVLVFRQICDGAMSVADMVLRGPGTEESWRLAEERRELYEVLFDARERGFK